MKSGLVIEGTERLALNGRNSGGFANDLNI